MREAAKEHHIHFLEDDSLEIDGVRFLGSTLWTDYKLRGKFTQSQNMRNAYVYLNDHSMIRNGSRLFTPQDALQRHQDSRAWLESELKQPFDGKTVVVSHHGPHSLSIHPRYIGDQLTCCFVSDLSDLMPGVDLWLHGHVHDSFDYTVGNCRVVANPAGYLLNRRENIQRNQFEFENESFNQSLVISL